MAQRSVFIGLVSHSNSSFLKSQGPEGLAAQLAVALEKLGFKTSIQVNSTNLFNMNDFALSPKMARDSVLREIELESKWSDFLNRPRRASHMLRVLGRRIKFLFDWYRNSETSELRRLLNIEYSHVDLYRAAVRSGAHWAVILEDDAYSEDPLGLARCLSLVNEAELTPKFVNLSSSFPLKQLGISHLMQMTPLEISGDLNKYFALQARRPATNTVCAIAFRTDFLAQILADFDSQPVEPVVPIDWKLNESLMRLWDANAIGAYECWFIEPAPIIQLSMLRDRQS